MKVDGSFSTEDNISGHIDDRLNTKSGHNDDRPKTLVNNFLSEDRLKSKSVLFISTGKTGDFQDRTWDTNGVTDEHSMHDNHVNVGTRGSISNGSRGNIRRDSDDDFRTSTPRGTVSPRESVSMSSTRLLSVKSEDSSRFNSDSVDMEDAASPASVERMNTSMSAWDAFQEHVKGVDVSSDLFSRKSKVSFKSSNTFQQTMTDLYGISEYGAEPEPEPEAPKTKPKMSNFNNFTSKLIATNRKKRRGTLEPIENPKPSKAMLETARRGWRLLRRHVQETITDKNGSKAGFMWASLSQTVRGLSDVEKTRIDLYKRYGVIPSVQPDGSSVLVNSMLSEKARVTSAVAPSSTIEATANRIKSKVSRRSARSTRSELLWSRTS